MTYNEAKTLYEHAPFQALWKSYNKKEKKNKVHREHYFGLQYRLQFRVIGLLCTYNFQKEIYISNENDRNDGHFKTVYQQLIITLIMHILLFRSIVTVRLLSLPLHYTPSLQLFNGASNDPRLYNLLDYTHKIHLQSFAIKLWTLYIYYKTFQPNAWL